MRTLYWAIIVIVVIIVLGFLAYVWLTPGLPNCDSTTQYSQVDAITGQDSNGNQCYCPTDQTTSSGGPLATWTQISNTTAYNCVYSG
jgi:hypothetical protein